MFKANQIRQCSKSVLQVPDVLIRIRILNLIVLVFIWWKWNMSFWNKYKDWIHILSGTGINLNFESETLTSRPSWKDGKVFCWCLSRDLNRKQVWTIIFYKKLFVPKIMHVDSNYIGTYLPENIHVNTFEFTCTFTWIYLNSPREGIRTCATVIATLEFTSPSYYRQMMMRPKSCETIFRNHKNLFLGLTKRCLLLRDVTVRSKK